MIEDPKIDYSEYYSNESHEIPEKLLYTGGVLGIGALAYNQAKKNNKVLEAVEKLPGARLLNDRLPQHAFSPQPLSKSIHSMILAAEEISPLHIAKTLGVSSFHTLFVELVDQEKGSIKIGSKAIRAYSEYYRNLILNSSGYALTKRDIQNGFLLDDNKLYLANKDGTKGRELLGYAKLISTNTEIGHQDSPNRIFKKFANIHGVDVHVSQSKIEPLAIVGGADKSQVMQDWIRATGRFTTEIGFKVLDNPLGFVEEMFGNLGVNTDNKIFKNKIVDSLKERISLGSNGVYNQGNRAAMVAMAKNLAFKATGAYTTYVTANALLEKITAEDNPWHNGIVSGLADTYLKIRIGLAKVWSDPLQSIRREQEEAAPESTELYSLAAFPLGGAMLGANLAYFKRMRDIAVYGLDEGARINTELRKVGGSVGALLGRLNPEGTTLARYGKLGALAGAAITLPFLPGALVGQSSDELTGEVAVRRNRGWLMNGSPFEGESIKYHRKTLIEEAITDARNKTLYKDGKEQREMDPIYSPFRYLKNPYAFEEAHQHDMPYPVWGMEVSYGSFMGKIYQGTIGQLIKPNVVRVGGAPGESRKDASLQADGMMEGQPTATSDATKEALMGTYAAFSDFTGLKGFAGSLALEALGLEPDDAPKLAVSGSANTLVDRYQSLQLGDALGCFTPDTRVLTSEGYKEIREIKVGDWVFPGRRVSKVYQKEFDQEILKVTIGGKVIFVTPNHVFPGFEDLKIHDRPIIDWDVGDELSSFTIERKEVVWYKGTMYDLEVTESVPAASTHYYNVEGIICHNSGEFVRRLLPQSADTKRDEVNPLKNTVAPSWLPRDTHRDFSTGNYFEKVADIGYTMLPGSRGFDALHPELRDIDPEDYSDAWKYKILQNVARGSREHYTIREKLINQLDTLSEEDRDVFFSAYEQDIARDEEKRFFETRDKEGMNPWQIVQNAIWENVAHLESPLEPLTPFRPMAKFLHQRTAIEDYRRTQLAGSDAAIWTKPIDHFINPAINRSIQLLDDTYKPRDVKEKENIDEYFDNLKLVKSSLGRPFDAANTIVSAAYSGMRTREDMLAFRRALPDNQTAYLQSFANDKENRDTILAMLPENIGRVYQSIWKNVDTYEKAVKEGDDPDKRLRDLYLRETEEIKKTSNISLTRKEVEGINRQAYKIRDRQERENFIEEQRAAKIRAKAAQKEAEAYVEETTGTPDSSWIGWDRRLTIDDIKLKTLTIGSEDVTRFGYWPKDQQRNDRITALDDDQQVVNNLESIRKRLRQQQDNKHLLKKRLREQGYEVHDISTNPGAGTVNIESP